MRRELQARKKALVSTLIACSSQEEVFGIRTGLESGLGWDTSTPHTQVHLFGLDPSLPSSIEPPCPRGPGRGGSY